MEVIVGDFDLEWKRKDGEVHKADYDDLIKAYEKQEEHDKEIQVKVIEEMLGQIEIRFLGVHPDKLYCGYTPSDVVDICKEIAEEMKEVDNG